MKALTLALSALLLLTLCACEQRAPLDIEALQGRARGGDPAALRELVSLLAVTENGIDARVYPMILELGAPAIPVLLEEAGADDRNLREHVIAALGTLKVREAVAPIAKVLADLGLGRRYVAAWALGEIGDPAGIPPLIRALDDDDRQVRRYATRALIRFNQAAVAPLLDYLGGASTRGEGGAVRVLGDIGDRRALDALLARTSGPNRGDVFSALGKLRDPRAEAALIAGLGDEEWRVRMNAAMALGPLGSPAAIEPLRKTMEDEVHVVREWSARSLETITGSHVLYRNEKGDYVPPYAIYH
jgi:HEAT repeat protein